MASARCDDEGVATSTTREQHATESLIASFFQEFTALMQGDAGGIQIMRSLHDEFCRSGLQGLSRAFKSLDASQPWIVYWIVHALHVMGCGTRPSSRYPRHHSHLGTRSSRRRALGPSGVNLLADTDTSGTHTCRATYTGTGTSTSTETQVQAHRHRR